MTNLITVNKEDHKAIHSGEKSLADVNKGGEMSKRQLINELEGIVKKLKKDSVSCESSVNFSRSVVSGIDPDNYQFQTHRPDGKMEIEIKISLYDKDDDESNDAFDPMDKIRAKTPNT